MYLKDAKTTVSEFDLSQCVFNIELEGYYRKW